MQVIRDNADFCFWLSNNGLDEEGQPVNSSAHFFQTPQFFARSRYTKMVPTIQNYTAENLEAAITKAIEDDEAEKGIKSVTFEEQKEMLSSEVVTLEALVAEVQSLGGQLANAGHLQAVVDTIEKHLGKGVKITDAKKGQEDIVSVLLDDLKDVVEEKLSE